MPYVFLRLSNGIALPASNWVSLERDAAFAFGITSYDLYREVYRRSGNMPMDAGELANWGMPALWQWEWAPLPCERRVRRHTDRTFLVWERWKAQPPDIPGGDC
jgi:hypothetical protein